MIAVLVLLAAMGCLALSIYKVKEWYRKNTWTADPDACEQEKVNLKMMEQARQRKKVIKPEPPPDGYTEIAAPFGWIDGFEKYASGCSAVCLLRAGSGIYRYASVFERRREVFYSIPFYGSYVLRGHSDISQGVFRVSYIPAGRFAGDGCVQLVLGAALFFSVPDPAV